RPPLPRRRRLVRGLDAPRRPPPLGRPPPRRPLRPEPHARHGAVGPPATPPTPADHLVLGVHDVHVILNVLNDATDGAALSEPLDPHTEREIVDQIALLFAQSGYPPMMGRILAFLTVCDPPEQSSQDLANYLHASKGAVSQATRMLMQAGLIERVHVRNSRSYWFRLRENAWQK